MDKETFCAILQSALLNFEGVGKNELIEKYFIKEKLAKAGIKLCDYLKQWNNGDRIN